MIHPWSLYECYSASVLRSLEFIFERGNTHEKLDGNEYRQRMRETIIPRKMVKNFPDSANIKGCANLLALFFLCAPILMALLAIGLAVGLNLQRGGIATFILFHWIYPLQFLCMSLFVYLRYKAFRLERKEKAFLETSDQELTYSAKDKPTNAGMVLSSSLGFVLGSLIILFSLYTDGFI